MFYLIRFALSGNPVGAPMADISEVIGKKAVEERISAAIDVLKQSFEKNGVWLTQMYEKKNYLHNKHFLNFGKNNDNIGKIEFWTI